MSNDTSDPPDAAAEDVWISERRLEAIDYLRRQEVKHEALHDWPAWHIYPYVSVWAIESGTAPGWVGWWVICGDCPTDYVTCTGDRTPRSAIEMIAARWREAATLLKDGKQHPKFTVGTAEAARELAPLLAARAELFEQFALDDSTWE